MNFNDCKIIYLEEIKVHDKLFNNLTTSEKKESFAYYSWYRSWFTNYLITALDLSKYDEMIYNLDVFEPITDKKQMSIYQYYVSNILKYIFIRNDLFINRLSPTDLLFIKKRINNKTYNYDTETKEFIIKTYKNVIFNDVKDGLKCKIFYDKNSSNYLVNNDSIVIGINNGKSKIKSKNLTVHDIKLKEYYNIIKKINNEANQKLDAELSILKYYNY